MTAMSVYSATKAATRSFARTWTNDLRERGIRVNAVSPGHIDTPIMQGLQQGDALTGMKEEFTKVVPLGRMGKPDEIAKAVSFLASDEASYISGIELFVERRRSANLRLASTPPLNHSSKLFTY